MLRQEKIKLIRNIIVAGFFAAFAYNWLFNGVILGRGYPANTFLTSPDWDFSDFALQVVITRQFSPYINTGISLKSNFPPFMHFLIWPSTLLPVWAATILFSLILAGFCAFIGARHLKGDSAFHTFYNTAGIIFCSYPFIFSFARGNFEAYVYILLYLAATSFPRWRSAVFVGLASACKILPGVWVLLFVDRKNWPKALLACCTALVLTVCGFALFPGGAIENFRAFRGVLAAYNEFWVLKPEGVAFSHSLYVALVFIAGTTSRWLASVYFWVAAGLGAAITLMLIKLESFWKKLALAVILMTLLPHVSTDYKLLHFFLPLFFFIDAPSGSFDRFYCWIFGLLMIPKAWVFFGGTDVSCSVVLTPALIILLLVGIVRESVAGISAEPLVNDAAAAVKKL